MATSAPRSRSPLSALFRWQTGKHENLENFCTEALANAIDSEPLLLLALLDRLKLLPAGVSAAALRRVNVATQGPTTTKGLVDLQLDLELADGRRAGLWIEVKVHAGLHGDQLSKYATELATQYSGAPHRLLVLSRGPVGPPQENLRWQQIRNEITEGAHQHWLDLRAFLEEQAVADQYDELLTSDDFRHVEPAQVVLRKVARSMAELIARLDRQRDDGRPDLWPRGFPKDEKQILGLISTTFQKNWGFVDRGQSSGRAVAAWRPCFA